MMQDDILTQLHTEAEKVDKLIPNLIWYLFGSMLRTPEQAADIDILILCEAEEQAKHVRRELHDLCMRVPLHLFLPTRAEEAELGFIASQGCVQVYPPIR